MDTQPTETAVPSAGWRSALALAAVVLGAVVPYLNKPIHMDGPVTIAMARHILEHPLDPLGYEINWDGRVHRGYELNNPPLTGYLVAAGIAVGGQSEVCLHLTESLMTALAAVAVFGLARRFCRHPVLVVALVLLSPGFIPSQNIMFDVTLLALWTAALWVWIEGVDRDRLGLCLVGAVLAGLSVLAKYSGLALLPLLVLHAALRRRWRVLWLLAAPVLIVVLWALHNAAWYGTPHMIGRPTPAFDVSQIGTRALTVLKALGGMTLVGLLGLRVTRCGRRAATRTLWAVLIVLAVGGAMAAPWFILNDHTSFQQRLVELEARGMVGYIMALRVTLTVMTGLGAAAVCAAACAACARADRPGGRAIDLTLLVWFVGVVGFNVLFSPFIAIRNLLPALPALVLLVVRAWEAAGPARAGRAGAGLALVAVLTAAVGYAVAEGDRGHAAAYRDAARRLAERWRARTERVWFVGYWGWQWYSAEAGMRDLHDRSIGQVRPGDLLIAPGGVHCESGHLALARQYEEVSPVPHVSWPVRTVSNFHRVGFYRSELDDVPYIISRFDDPPIAVMRIRSPRP